MKSKKFVDILVFHANFLLSLPSHHKFTAAVHRIEGFGTNFGENWPRLFYRELRKPRRFTCQQQSIKSNAVEAEAHVVGTHHRGMWQTHANSRCVNQLVALWYAPHSERCSRLGKHNVNFKQKDQKIAFSLSQ